METTPYTVSFEVSERDSNLIHEIVMRAAAEYQPTGIDIDRLSMVMDLTACHANGTRLDLPRMLAGGSDDLLHDLSGIRSNLNRRSGKLENCFLPRFAMACQE